MKRIELETLTSYPTPSTSIQPDVSAAHVSQPNGESTSHSLLVPLHYEKNYAYPLLIWLHGSGDNERQLKRVMPLVSLRNYVAIAPQGTSHDDQDCAHRWVQSQGDILEAQWRVGRCIELAQHRCHIHPERIFIGGYADGGTMALRLALRMPHLFAGAFSLGGGLPQSHQPLVNLDRARGLSMLIGHSENSRRFPTSQLCRDIRLLHAAGMALAVRQYPCGDELTTQMLSDLDVWLMERVTGQIQQCNRRATDVGEMN